MSLKLKIITPKKTFFEGDVDMLNIDTISGWLGILPNHIPLVSAIRISQLNFLKSGERVCCTVAGGIVYVQKHEIKIITNSIERVDEIDLNRAIEARDRAENLLKNRQENIDVERAELALRRALNRIHATENPYSRS